MNRNADGERVTEAKSGRRRRRWLVWGMAVSIIVLLFSPVMIFRAVNKAAFERKVAELKAAGYPVSLDDLEAAYVLPEGVENAADVYLQAFRAYVEPNEAEMALLPVRGNYEATDDMPPYPPEVIEAIRISLEKNKKCIELINQASRIEYCLFPDPDYNNYFYYTFNDVLYENETQQALRKMLFLTKERNLYLAHTQQTDELLESVKAGIGLCNRLTPEPMLIEYVMMLAMRYDVINGLEEVINLVVLTDEYLRQLQQSVRQKLLADSFTKAIINERAGCIQCFHQLSIWRKVFCFDGLVHKGMIVLYDVSGLKAKDSVTAIEFYQRQIDAANLPYHKQAAEFRKIVTDLSSYNHVTHYGLQMTVGNSCYPYSANMRVAGQVMCGETALAVERYRVKYGKLPEGLGELVPEFLAEVYLDPFDGKPLRYVLRAEGGYVIYCIGEDGVDNGGVDMSHKVTGAGGAPEYDWPFTVRR